jgi:multiple sugar transport system ATP-binding protein
MAHVSLRGIYKTYADAKGRVVHAAVSDVNIEVADREFLVLVGPSGCGKSTTLRMIAGLEEISRGDIFIDDRRVNDVAPKDRDIAMVFQSYALYPHMSVYDNMAFGLKLRKYPKAEIKKRVGEAAGILGIESMLDRKPKQLSGGQRQRVALGRAIVRQPKVFLFDEPLSNLDAKMRVQTRTELIKLHQRLQATMIYVTHDQVEAMTMGSRIAVMKDGVLQQNEAPLTLYKEPRNLFVAGFLGSPAMNFIGGKLSARGDRLIFKEMDGGAIECPFQERERPALKAYVDREVILGIRPEDIALSQGASAPADVTFQAVVDIVEMMGAETNFYLQTGHQTVICRSQAIVDQREAGHRLQFQMNPARAHMFDPVTTNRIV